MKKPLILVVNDDGIRSKGIRTLIDIVNNFGEVVVVAPNSPQSGKSHSISLEEVIRCNKIDIDNGNQIEYECSGSPVDCVKLAINKILSRQPDLIVSGINHGSNSAINVLYSGTMAAAIEGSLLGIPSIGFSLLDYNSNADFSESVDFIKKIINNVLNNGLPKYVSLNVNIPKSKKSYRIKGIKICRQAKSKWVEEFVEKTDPKGNKYFWLTGKFINLDTKEDTDEYALSNHYVSIVPIKHDLTSYSNLKSLDYLF